MFADWLNFDHGEMMINRFNRLFAQPIVLNKFTKVSTTFSHLPALSAVFQSPSRLFPAPHWFNTRQQRSFSNYPVEGKLLPFVKEILPGVNYAQARTLYKLSVFLQQEGRNPKVIEKVKNEGHCNGFSILFLYTIWLEALTLKLKGCNTSLPRTDATWFWKTQTKISCWDGKKPLSNEDKSDFDTLISHIRFFQDPSRFYRASQAGLDRMIEDTRLRHPQLEYAIGGLFSADDFTKPIIINPDDDRGWTKILTGGPTTFLNELIRHRNRSIMIRSNSHATAMFTHDFLYYYNSNFHNAIRIYNYTQSQQVVPDLFSAHYLVNEIAPFRLSIFTFDKELKEYPNSKDLLKAINSPLQVDGKFENRRLGILNATAIGDIDSVKYYLQKGESVNAHVGDYYTPLISAIYSHRTSLLAFLLSQPDINVEILYQHTTPLRLAIQNYNYSAVELLLQHGCDPEVLSQDGENVLHFAIINNNITALDLLLAYGANVNAVTQSGLRPINIAVYEDNIYIVKQLLKYGADANGLPTENHTETPLFIAVERNNLEMVKVLVEAGADINHAVGSDLTPFEVACEAKNAEMITYLLDQGAMPPRVKEESRPRPGC